MGKRKSGLDIHGIVLLDKRLGVSSNQALQEVRRLFNANKAGHTGSLDPLATGLLPLCFGEATKVSALMLDDNKRYTVTFRLGVMTDTGDSEGNIIAEMPVPPFSEAELRACLEKFTGPIDQVPPMYSALKFQGKKLYELARQGITIERKARQITIFELNLLAFAPEFITLDVACSKGTYIRSLAQDIGEQLGSCATVTALRRTASGRFDISQAFTLPQLQALSGETLHNTLIAVDAPLADIPSVELSDEQAQRIKQGQQIDWPSPVSALPATARCDKLPATITHDTVRIYSQQAFLGLGVRLLNGKLAPRKLFNMNDEIN